ncbi:hypothetical protein JQX13_31590 [Archangium violaceum]|uniref:hypothetical protein n=1 Tax=Archangium violaceum TaxID=83451 RepID=UPI00193BF006|nr:hypothetical protein [Archangium violaceum]QRK04752.1 hypothetical protein JQX13_31590 [Archangium violaceum]
MLTIRKSQLEAFGEVARRSFEDKMLEHLAGFWVFGHGCFEDPLQPWIAQTLGDTATSDPEDRASLLKTRAFAWLEQLLAHQTEGVRS